MLGEPVPKPIIRLIKNVEDNVFFMSQKILLWRSTRRFLCRLHTKKSCVTLYKQASFSFFGQANMGSSFTFAWAVIKFKVTCLSPLLKNANTFSTYLEHNLHIVPLRDLANFVSYSESWENKVWYKYLWVSLLQQRMQAQEAQGEELRGKRQWVRYTGQCVNRLDTTCHPAWQTALQSNY